MGRSSDGQHARRNKTNTASATTQTLQTFLVSMERAPQLYWGRTLNLAAEYGQWVKTGSLDYSLIDAFTKALDKSPEFEVVKKNNISKLTRDFLINQTNAATILAAGYINPDSYYKTMQAIEKLLPATITGNDLGFLYFQSGSARITAKTIRRKRQTLFSSCKNIQQHKRSSVCTCHHTRSRSPRKLRQLRQVG